MMNRRVQNKISPVSDNVLVNARLSQAVAEFKQVEAASMRAKAQLEQVIGQSVVDVVIPSDVEVSAQGLDAAIVAALNNSPALRRLSAQEAAATAEIGLKRSSRLPRVLLRYERDDGSLKDNRIYVALSYQSGPGLSSLSSERESAALREAVIAERLSVRRDVVEAVSI